jgi:hypothetical protein
MGIIVHLVQIFRWYARFKSGVETTEDEASPGRPFSVRNEGLIAKLRERIQEERCVTVRMMADEFGVNRETWARERSLPGLCHIHCLMIKDTSVFSTQKTIKTARINKNFLKSIVAEDETWCFRYDPTTKRQC